MQWRCRGRWTGISDAKWPMKSPLWPTVCTQCSHNGLTVGPVLPLVWHSHKHINTYSNSLSHTHRHIQFCQWLSLLINMQCLNTVIYFIHVMLRLISEFGCLGFLRVWCTDYLWLPLFIIKVSADREICIELIFDQFLIIFVDVAFHHFAKENLKPQSLTDLHLRSIPHRRSHLHINITN